MVSRTTDRLFIDFLIADDMSVLESGDLPKYIPFPIDFAGYLHSNGFWSAITPAAPVSIGGADGYQIDAIGKASASSRMGFLNCNTCASGFKEFVGPDAQKFRFIFLENISGKRLLVVIGFDVDPGVSAVSVSQFDASIPQIQEVLDTVVFTKP